MPASSVALLGNPKLLIMDEPSEGLAPTIVDQRIENLKSDGVSPISVFNYTYDAAQRLQTWTQQEDASSATAKTWTFGHDKADQLTSLLSSQGDPTLGPYAGTYAPARKRPALRSALASSTW